MSRLPPAKHIFTIASATPFLKTVAEALCDGRLTPHFRYDVANPLSLAGVTIFVPTRRSARVLRSEFVDFLGYRSAILPVIRPLGESDEDGIFFDADPPAAADLLPPVSGTSRLVELARLILAWRNSLPMAIRAVHSDSPLVAPVSPADAIWLARALSEVIDAMETEEADWTALGKLDTADHAQWWQLTSDFLKIARHFWPARLEELHKSSADKYRNTLLRAEALRLSRLGETGTVIVAGSTGSIPAAAELISTVAGLPQGVVILPGLDQSLPQEQWRAIGAAPDDAAGRTHPQYGLFTLLQKLGVRRDEVERIGTPPGDLQERAAVLSIALAPASATSEWNVWREDKDQAFFDRAFASVSLIEAINEREEATAIAVALRLALEKPGRRGPAQAALITPDRGLARRVAIELGRFGIEADDSAGMPLGATPHAGITQLALETILRPGDPVAVLSLLKHPLCRFGLPAEEVSRAVTGLELFALCGGKVEIVLGDLEELLDRQLALHEKNRHPPAWLAALPEGIAAEAGNLARRITQAIAPLDDTGFPRHDGIRHLTTRLPLSQWAQRTARVLEAICVDAAGNLAGLWSGEAGEKLAGLFAELIDSGEVLEADGPQWIDVMAALVATESIKPRTMRHPRVFIFGALEARLQSMDTVVIGALNEGVWPGQTGNNPFLSRAMKTAIGLEPPEWRIGQLAHDFEMANGATNVIYSRALRQGSTPAIASRWLQRLLALGGENFAAGLRARGKPFVQWAAMLDESAPQAAAIRPSPRPPAKLQPASYSFSEVGRLRRDPYAIYAERILRLHPLHPFNRDRGAADRGTLYHRIIEDYGRAGHAPGSSAAHEAMQRILHDCFDAENLPPHIDIVWRQRFAAVAEEFLLWESKRRHLVRRSHIEVHASQEIAEAGIRLTGVADRIDILASGRADIIDFKTGLSPSLNQARALLDPQLALEAGVLMRGGFSDAGSLVPENLLYVRLRPGIRFSDERINNEYATRSDRIPPLSAVEMANEAIEQLGKFVAALRDGRNGFASRLMPVEQQAYDGEYDHLARVSEWATTERGGDDAD